MRTADCAPELVRRAYHPLLGPAAFAMVITSCGSSNADLFEKTGITSAAGSVGSDGTGGGSDSVGAGVATAAGSAAAAGSATAEGGAAEVDGAAGAGGGTSGGGAAGSGAAGGPSGVTVQLGQTHQTIEGFGLNTALSGGTIPWDTVFTTTGADGIGLSIVRVAVNSDGNISGDISGAKSHGVKVIGAAWSPPANCKDNNNTQKGGHLKADCYASFASTIANAAKNQGLYAMSAANEPDFASCGSTIGPPCNGDYDTALYTANEMVAFIKVLGPSSRTRGSS
jgi:hypothetical protein